MLPFLAIPTLGAIAYKTYKYGSKAYKATQKINNASKFSKTANNASKFSKSKIGVGVRNSATDTTGAVSALVGAGVVTAYQNNNLLNEDIAKTVEDNSRVIKSAYEDISNRTNDDLSSGDTLISALQNSAKIQDFNSNKMMDIMSVNNAVISQNLEMINASYMQTNQNILTLIDSIPIIMGAVLTDMYSQTATIVESMPDNTATTASDTIVNVSAPVVNFDTASLVSSISGLASEINPTSRTDFYDKHNFIADYKVTAKPIYDLDGNLVTTETPMETQTKHHATNAKLRTDQNNFELDEEDFDSWDSFPIMDFLYPDKFSNTFNGS